MARKLYGYWAAFMDALDRKGGETQDLETPYSNLVHGSATSLRLLHPSFSPPIETKGVHR
jgi:hypothetical protein